MADETRKILHAPEILVSATCVRVPVYVSHSAALHLEFDHPMPVDEARELLAAMPGVKVVDNPEQGGYPMPWDAAGEDAVFVGRIRQDQSLANGLALWVVSDNLRKGAALNAMQIAEELVRRDCLRPRGGRHKSMAPEESCFERIGELSLESGRATFQEDLAYFNSHREELLRDYRGKWIAIIRGTVVDTDDEFAALAQRVYSKYGYRAILMTRVETETPLVNLYSPIRSED
jgi:hypothetical protein